MPTMQVRPPCPPPLDLATEHPQAPEAEVYKGAPELLIGPAL